MPSENLILILQASIAPVVLISGAGLLLLSMTNRLGRTTDRIRHLCDASEAQEETQGAALKEQIRILYSRARSQRTAIFLVTISIICVSLIIFALFISAVYELDLKFLVVVLFQAAVFLLTASLVFLLMEVWASLHSLEIEVEHFFENK